MKILVRLILGSAVLFQGCDKRVGEFKYTCRSNVDCKTEGVSCLPFYKGTSLQDFCDKASCPTKIQGFDLFTTVHAMPKICDFDRNNDGVADVSKDYVPYSYEYYIANPSSTTSYDSEDYDYFDGDTVDRGHEVVFEQEGKVLIYGLFDTECNVTGLNYVSELGICLPPPLSSNFCDTSDDCNEQSYCSIDAAVCVVKREVAQECNRDEMCHSSHCRQNYCVDFELGSPCWSSEDCKEGLGCTGQQTTAPGFSATSGQRFCGDKNLYSPCDPANFRCNVGSCEQFDPYSCPTSICDDSSQCNDMCERTEPFGRSFICLPD